MTQADSVHSTPPTNTSAVTTTERPADAAGELYYPTDISPETAFQALGRLRKEAQDEIDRLLSFLDATEADPDFEPSMTGYLLGMDDREGDDCDFEDGNDGEPAV